MKRPLPILGLFFRDSNKINPQEEPQAANFATPVRVTSSEPPTPGPDMTTPTRLRDDGEPRIARRGMTFDGTEENVTTMRGVSRRGESPIARKISVTPTEFSRRRTQSTDPDRSRPNNRILHPSSEFFVEGQNGLTSMPSSSSISLSGGQTPRVRTSSSSDRPERLISCVGQYLSDSVDALMADRLSNAGNVELSKRSESFCVSESLHGNLYASGSQPPAGEQRARKCNLTPRTRRLVSSVDQESTGAQSSNRAQSNVSTVHLSERATSFCESQSFCRDQDLLSRQKQPLPTVTQRSVSNVNIAQRATSFCPSHSSPSGGGAVGRETRRVESTDINSGQSNANNVQLSERATSFCESQSFVRGKASEQAQPQRPESSLSHVEESQRATSFCDSQSFVRGQNSLQRQPQQLNQVVRGSFSNVELSQRATSFCDSQSFVRAQDSAQRQPQQLSPAVLGSVINVELSQRATSFCDSQSFIRGQSTARWRSTRPGYEQLNSEQSNNVIHEQVSQRATSFCESQSFARAQNALWQPQSQPPSAPQVPLQTLDGVKVERTRRRLPTDASTDLGLATKARTMDSVTLFSPGLTGRLPEFEAPTSAQSRSHSQHTSLSSPKKRPKTQFARLDEFHGDEDEQRLVSAVAKPTRMTNTGPAKPMAVPRVSTRMASFCAAAK